MLQHSNLNDPQNAFWQWSHNEFVIIRFYCIQHAEADVLEFFVLRKKNTKFSVRCIDANAQTIFGERFDVRF